MTDVAVAAAAATAAAAALSWAGPSAFASQFSSFSSSSTSSAPSSSSSSSAAAVAAAAAASAAAFAVAGKRAALGVLSPAEREATADAVARYAALKVVFVCAAVSPGDGASLARWASWFGLCCGVTGLSAAGRARAGALADADSIAEATEEALGVGRGGSPCCRSPLQQHQEQEQLRRLRRFELLRTQRSRERARVALLLSGALLLLFFWGPALGGAASRGAVLEEVAARSESSGGGISSSFGAGSRLLTLGLWLPDAVGPAVDALTGLCICVCSFFAGRQRQRRRREEDGEETSFSFFSLLFPAPSSSSSLAFHAAIIAGSLPRVASLCHAASVWALRSGGGGGEKTGLASLFDLGLDGDEGGGDSSSSSTFGAALLALPLPFPRRYLSIVDAALAVDAHSALWALMRTARAYLRYRAACRDLFGEKDAAAVAAATASAADAAGAAASAADARCPICLDPLLQEQQQGEPSIVVTTACGHCFHGGCLKGWLRRGCSAAAGGAGAGGGRGGIGASPSSSLEGTPCPLCRQPLERKVLRRRRELEEREQQRRRQRWATAAPSSSLSPPLSSPPRCRGSFSSFFGPCRRAVEVSVGLAYMLTPFQRRDQQQQRQQQQRPERVFSSGGNESSGPRRLRGRPREEIEAAPPLPPLRSHPLLMPAPAFSPSFASMMMTRSRARALAAAAAAAASGAVAEV